MDGGGRATLGAKAESNAGAVTETRNYTRAEPDTRRCSRLIPTEPSGRERTLPGVALGHSPSGQGSLSAQGV